mgnify:CR=1 FL=1
MGALPTGLDKLVSLLARLPGVGQRSATRLALFILSEPDEYAAELGEALSQLNETVELCERCHTVSEHPICRICSDPARGGSTLCIVEGIADLMAIERTGVYRGRYHVIHGTLAPLKGIGPGQLKLDNLLERIHDEDIEEIIIATSTSVEGEATAIYLSRILSTSDVTVSRIATGIPHGGDLEYIDATTLSRAIDGRRLVDP